MATTRSNSGLDIFLDACRTFFHQKRNQVLELQAKREVYRRTVSELSYQSDRTLKDLGIPRSGIKRIAMEAAYGQ